MKDVDTTEDDRPSLKLKATKIQKLNPKPKAAKKRRQSNDDIQATNTEVIEAPNETIHVEESTIPMTAQTAISIVDCIECRKPRVLIYATSKLTKRQQTQFAVLLSEFDYTCGSGITPTWSQASCCSFCSQRYLLW